MSEHVKTKTRMKNTWGIGGFPEGADRIPGKVLKEAVGVVLCSSGRGSAASNNEVFRRWGGFEDLDSDIREPCLR